MAADQNINVAEYSHNLVQAAEEAAGWVEKNAGIVGSEKEGLLKDLRKAKRAFKACGKSAGKQMCAGVFGPSQAGKSYLISALARGESNELIALFGDSQIDFISEINPEGGKESTGLVTRFTLIRPQNIPPDYPVQLRLLSETDLVKIIANTYYADCNHTEDPKSSIAKTLEQLKARPAGTGMDLDMLEDLREYLIKDFKSSARVQELEKNFWNEALLLGQKLSLEDRIKLYALIWDETEELTELLRTLLLALEKLDFPDLLFCSQDALIPRDTSIIDVATLARLNEPDQAMLKVCTPKGAKMELPKPVIAALTAELAITMRDKPADYFNHTDLLDFPGYRSRYQLEDIHHELKKNKKMLYELFLRGKVAYLFQRYCAERELNSMLLCIGNGNQEVQDLPGVISGWIASTHGQTPEDRKDKPVSLLFILTKADLEFENKKGAPSLESRWDNRLKASLLDFFGKQKEWPFKWTPERGFDNIFLLRNPNFKFEAILSFNKDTETGIRPESMEFVEKLHSSFINSPLVAAHFKNPARAWNEFMKLNDGGISFIRQSLSPLCDPAIKKAQLLENINYFKNALIRRLKPFYHTDNRDEMRKQKAALVKSLFKNLGILQNRQQRLGQLLRAFTITDAEIYDMHQEALRRYREQPEPEPQKAEETAAEEIDLESFDLENLNPFLSENAKNPAAGSQEEDNKINDEAAFYASYIESKWVEHLHLLAEDPHLQKYFMLAPGDFSALASELATGAARFGFKEKLADDFRKAAAYSNTRKENIARKQAAIAACIINGYVNWLGFNPAKQTESERTVSILGSRDITVFSAQKPFKGVPQIAETASPFTANWLGNWLNALAALIMANADFDGKETINVQQNSALGAILAKLQK